MKDFKEIEINDETNSSLVMTEKLQNFLQEEILFAENFVVNTNSIMSNYYADSDLSSHFGFCDDNKISAVLSTDMRVIFISYE